MIMQHKLDIQALAFNGRINGTVVGICRSLLTDPPSGRREFVCTDSGGGGDGKARIIISVTNKAW